MAAQEDDNEEAYFSSEDEYEYTYEDSDTEEQQEQQEQQLCGVKRNASPSFALNDNKTKGALSPPSNAAADIDPSALFSDDSGEATASTIATDSSLSPPTCPHCNQESHAPVSSCQLLEQWQENGDSLGILVLPAKLVIPAMRRRIEECAERMEIMPHEAFEKLRQYGWDLQVLLHTEQQSNTTAMMQVDDNDDEEIMVARIESSATNGTRTAAAPPAPAAARPPRPILARPILPARPPPSPFSVRLSSDSDDDDMNFLSMMMSFDMVRPSLMLPPTRAPPPRQIPPSRTPLRSRVQPSPFASTSSVAASTASATTAARNTIQMKNPPTNGVSKPAAVESGLNSNGRSSLKPAAPSPAQDERSRMNFAYKFSASTTANNNGNNGQDDDDDSKMPAVDPVPVEQSDSAAAEPVNASAAAAVPLPPDSAARLPPAAAAGIANPQAPAAVGSPSCAICMDDFQEQDMMGMACGHLFCRDCWGHYIENMLHNSVLPDECLQTTCPSPSCNVVVSEIQIGQVAPHLLPKYESLQLHSFVEGHRNTMRWCTGPDCNDRIAVKCREGLFPGRGNSSVVHCGDCHTQFCFRCGQAPHADRYCEMEERLGLSNSKHKPIKNCPKCNIKIEKNGGCNHMRCNCGHEFCWICLADMYDYSHFCGREGDRADEEDIRARRIEAARRTIVVAPLNLDYVCEALKKEWGWERNDDIQNVLYEKKEMDRIAHYRTRFEAHEQGQRFAENQCDLLGTRAIDFAKSSDLKSATDTDFLAAANERLVAARRMLKWTYCYAYYLPDEEQEGMISHKGLFQNHQERLERFTEQLSEISEHALTYADRAKIVNFIGIIDQCMKAIVEFEEFGAKYAAPKQN